MKKLSALCLSAAALAAAVSAAQSVGAYTADEAPAKVAAIPSLPQAEGNMFTGGFTKSTSPLRAPGSFRTGESALQPGFSVLGHEAADVTVWSENFDDGADGWTLEPTSYATWTTKQIGAPGTAKSFSAIDPDDVQSLFVEGPYQTFRREITNATSPAFDVPANATLDAWIGYSLNYEDTNSLTISISDDDFATSAQLWHSNESGETSKPWAWRKISLSLADYAGKTVKIRFTYGPGTDDIFNTGGYLGDYSIDGIKVNAKQSVDHVDVMTGETVQFLDITEGEVASRLWSFPGGVPSESTEASPVVYYTDDGSYDVSLTVTDAEGNSSTTTATAFVGVTGTAPVGAILPPATFRRTTTGKYMVAPSVPVTFRDASAGFPSECHWIFSGTSDDSGAMEEIDGPEATVIYHYQHDWPVGLSVSNRHGNSDALAEVSAEFQGEISNLRADDQITVADLWDGEGRFPGSGPASLNVTAYAERFSAPSAPVFIPGVNVYFVDTEAGELIDQIQSVTVSICKVGPDGCPGEKLESASWAVFELDGPTATGLRATQFEFSNAVILNEPFFVTVEGIPPFREATEENGRTLVTFGMAAMRGEGGTALWKKNGQWQEIADYFPAGQNHTSFMICPYVAHSILTTFPLDDSREITLTREAGSVDKVLYTLYEIDEPTVDVDWLSVTRDDPTSTLQTVTIAYDALPDGSQQRTGHITFTDGASTMVWTVTQTTVSGITVIESDPAAGVASGMDAPAYYNLQGIRVANPTHGTYILITPDGKATKIQR